MITPNSMLNIMPWSCRFCVQGYKALLHISREAILNNLNLIELEGPEAVWEPVWGTLTSMDPIFVNGFGHGNREVFTGDTEEAIFTSASCSVLANRVVYLLSCYTAVQLGPAIINAGGMAYGGYKIAWTWMSEDLDADPYDLLLAEAFYRATNEFPIALIQGATVSEAKERCLAEYSRWIEIWATERGEHIDAAAVIKWLIHDRDGLVVLGNQLATIVSPGIPTSFIVDVEPPQNVHPGASFDFQGRLLDRDTSSPLSGKEVRFYKIGLEEPLASTLTDGDGVWLFDVLLPGGRHTIYASFPGNDYGPSYSPTFGVEVGLTQMQVITPPRSSVEVGETIPFVGTLIDKSTMLGIPGRPIQLIGAGSMATITDENGNWAFSVFFPTEGRYRLHVEFLGDSLFAGSETTAYRISVGMLPIVGCDEVSDPLAYKNCSWRIIGTTFRTQESGIAQSIVVWLHKLGSNRASRMKCAIYRRSDMSLIGVTEERTFPAGIFRKWVSFIMVGSPRLEADTEIVLVGWASNDCYLRWIQTGDDTQAIEPWDVEYNSFPDPYTAIRYWRDQRHTIYCEYLPDGAPPPPTRVLTIETLGQGTTDPAPGPWEYPEGSQVQVSAIPAAGWAFHHWEGDASGTANPITIIVTQDMAIRAVFTEIIVPPEEHSVSISVIGQGTTNPPVGSYIVPDGESMVITAFPAAGWLFDRWQGSISSTENPVTIQVFSDMSIVAVFMEIIIPTHIVTIGVEGQGTTEPTPGPWEYDEGSQASIAAIPAAGWRFVGWGGDIPSTDNPLTFTVIIDVSITAVFEEIIVPPTEYAVSISVIGQGTTDPAPGTHIILEGTILTVTAYPAEGWLFDHWEGDVSGTNHVLEVQVLSDLSVVAVFVEQPVPTYTLTIETVGQGETVPAPGTHIYDEGSLVSVSAIPDASWEFSRWEGAISGTANPIDLTIIGDMLIRAVFTEVIVPPEEHAVTISVVGQGTTDPTPGTYSELDGTIFTVRAIPAEGWLFDHWGGSISGMANPIDIEVLAGISVVAVFVEEAEPPPPPKPRWMLPVLLGGIIAAVFVSRKK